MLARWGYIFVWLFSVDSLGLLWGRLQPRWGPGTLDWGCLLGPSFLQELLQVGAVPVCLSCVLYPRRDSPALPERL